MEQGYVDPSSYTEFPDEEHSVLCEWWYKDRKYKGWFDPEQLEEVVDKRPIDTP
jgi:hypothetical protein